MRKVLSRMNLQSVEWAYLAAVIDTEGYLRYRRRLRSGSKALTFEASLRIRMVALEPITTVANWLGLPLKQRVLKNRNAQPLWELEVYGDILKSVLQGCLPYFKAKSELATEILEIWDSN